MKATRRLRACLARDGWVTQALVFARLCLLALLLPVAGHAQGHTLAAPLLYSATAPACTAIAPTGGATGTSVTLTGRNLHLVKNVLFGTQQALFTVPARDRIVATVPQTGGSTAVAYRIDVISSAGRAACRTLFVYTPTRTVPNLVGRDLQSATQTLQAATLRLGTVSGPSLATSRVDAQSPSAGSTVVVNSAVNVTTSTPVNGVRSLTLQNNLSDGHGIYLWLWNYSTQQWSLQNGGSLLPSQAVSTPMVFVTGQLYGVAAVDPLWCGQNDPSVISCLHWSLPGPIRGDANGPAVVMQTN